MHGHHGELPPSDTMVIRQLRGRGFESLIVIPTQSRGRVNLCCPDFTLMWKKRLRSCGRRCREAAALNDNSAVDPQRWTSMESVIPKTPEALDEAPPSSSPLFRCRAICTSGRSAFFRSGKPAESAECRSKDGLATVLPEEFRSHLGDSRLSPALPPPECRK